MFPCRNVVELNVVASNNEMLVKLKIMNNLSLLIWLDSAPLCASRNDLKEAADGDRGGGDAVVRAFDPRPLQQCLIKLAMNVIYAFKVIFLHKSMIYCHKSK